MGKKITAYKVDSLSKVDTTLYVEGDHFITKRSIGVLVNGKVKSIGNDPVDTKDFVKKNEIKDFVTFETVQQMINDSLESGE